MRKSKPGNKWHSEKKHRRGPSKPSSFKAQSFYIESIDPLGQGVAKSDDGITFIAKTLPREKVLAQVVKKKKGVSFAVLKDIEEKADNRISPSCQHFDDCPGCHFLHTDYASELVFKTKTLTRLLEKLKVGEENITVVEAPQRDGYRNRIQLHYRASAIGLIDGLSDKIIEIPHCRIIRDELKPGLAALYLDRSWCENNPGEGHCELYFKDGNVTQEWNSSYAHGGFTQVFEDMNNALCATVAKYLQRSSVTSLLDLFAGNGNLSRQFAEVENTTRTMVDQSAANGKDFYNMDLYADNALVDFRKQCSETRFDAILIDPPRKGFPALSSWVKTFKPKKLVYVSCNAATMVRDLINLNTAFSIDQVELLDLFPSTYHFETICFISFKGQ